MSGDLSQLGLNQCICYLNSLLPSIRYVIVDHRGDDPPRHSNSDVNPQM